MKHHSTAIALIAILLAAAGVPFAQDHQIPDSSEGKVSIIELFPPTYPDLARLTRIASEVQLELKIEKDGKVHSVEAISGHPLLVQAAVDSAKRSRFLCQNCNDNQTSYQLTYTFQIVESENCCALTKEGFPKVSQLDNHITVLEGSVCECDPGVTITTIKVRSIKCLYLRHCSVRYPA